MSTFIGKDEQSVEFQPDPVTFQDSAEDRDKILTHNEAIDTILDQLQDAIEDAREAARLRKRSEETRAGAVKKQKL